MLNIETLILGSYRTNCYLVWQDGPGCVVIDPGYEPETVLSRAAELGLEIQAIFLTHGHFDHVGGVPTLQMDCACPVYLCTEDCTMPRMLTAGPLHYTNAYGEGDEITAAGVHFTVLHTPGHTPGSVCLRCGDVLFTGDTLFAGGCGRTDLPGGSTRSIRDSLNRLSKLPGDYRVYPGHGSSTTLETERKSNPYL